MATYGQYSPYAFTTSAGGYLDVINFIDLPAQLDDIQWTVISGYMHRPDLLANDIYGTPELWWVFAVRNKDVIQDPIYDLVPGQVIYLPKLSTIQAALGTS